MDSGKTQNFNYLASETEGGINGRGGERRTKHVFPKFYNLTSVGHLLPPTWSKKLRNRGRTAIRPH